MFEFLTKKHKQSDPMADDRVYVQLPALIKLQFKARGFSFLPRQPVNSQLTGRHSSKLRGRGLNFEELRHYRAGDDIRTMDWKVTNRTGKPHVRVYTEERERNVMLLIDQRVSMFFGSQQSMKSVTAAEAAALAAWRVLDVGDRVGAVIFNDDEVISIPPARSRATVIHILSKLAEFNQRLKVGRKSNPAQLNEALKALSRNLSHDAVVISFGDGAGWDGRATEQVRRIARHNDIFAFKVFDPAELELPPLKQLVVSDGQLQLELTGSKSELRQKFRRQYEDDLGLMRRELKKYAIPVITLDTVEPVLRQLTRALGGVASNGARR